MRILGFDPGLVRLGYSVVEKNDETEEFSLLHFGYLSHPRVENEYNRHLNNAIHSLCNVVPKLLHEFEPHQIAAEIVPVGRLKSNTELVVAAITVCKVIAFQWGVPWHDYGANTIKKTVTDDGLATKAQVKNAVMKQFPEIVAAHKEEQKKQKDEGKKRAPGLPADVYDSIAIALTGLAKL